jgi:hypothetical protein
MAWLINGGGWISRCDMEIDMHDRFIFKEKSDFLARPSASSQGARSKDDGGATVMSLAAPLLQTVCSHHRLGFFQPCADRNVVEHILLVHKRSPEWIREVELPFKRIGRLATCQNHAAPECNDSLANQRPVSSACDAG